MRERGKREWEERGRERGKRRRRKLQQGRRLTKGGPDN